MTATSHTANVRGASLRVRWAAMRDGPDETGPNEEGPADPDVTQAAVVLLDTMSAESHVDFSPQRPRGIVRALHLVRLGIERVTSFTGHISWVLAWVVFGLGFFNVVTRYLARYIERDIIIGQIFDLQWMLFGALFLAGLNYGVREGVNPRIDFWWADFSARRKAIIDLAIHVLLFIPFLVVAVVVLWRYAMAGLGRSFDGSWSTWRVWEIWEQSPDAAGLPRGPIKFMLLFGFILMLSQVVAEVIKNGFVLIGREELAGLAAHEAPQRVE